MKKAKIGWQVCLGAFLLILSAMLYLLHYSVFHDAHHIFLYLLGDLAFLPVEVLLVTLVVHTLLSEREKRSRLNKLNMVIGVFFSEVGDRLIRLFSGIDPHLDRVQRDLKVLKKWPTSYFKQVSRKLEGYEYTVDMRKDSIEELKSFLLGKRQFLIVLLENPTLLEHESFTELLWAVFHLAEELSNRKNIAALQDKDAEHLAGDIVRAYKLLVAEWIEYMRHLKDNYPYLYSLAMRTNPFDEEASVVIS